MLLLCAAGFQGMTQEIMTADAYLERISGIYGNVNDYIADFTITDPGDNQFNGKIYYKTPNKLRLNFTNPAEQVIVMDGRTFTAYLPRYGVILTQKFYRRSSSELASLVSNQGLNMMRQFYSVSYVNGESSMVPLDAGEGENEAASDEKVVKLLLTWRSKSEGFVNIELSINAQGYIRRIIGTTRDYGSFQFDFTNIRINTGVPDGVFDYDSPATTNEIEDYIYPEE